jgi:hypothetical protein
MRPAPGSSTSSSWSSRRSLSGPGSLPCPRVPPAVGAVGGAPLRKRLRLPALSGHGGLVETGRLEAPVQTSSPSHRSGDGGATLDAALTSSRLAGDLIGSFTGALSVGARSSDVRSQHNGGRNRRTRAPFRILTSPAVERRGRGLAAPCGRLCGPPTSGEFLRSRRRARQLVSGGCVKCF